MFKFDNNVLVAIDIGFRGNYGYDNRAEVSNNCVTFLLFILHTIFFWIGWKYFQECLNNYSLLHQGNYVDIFFALVIRLLGHMGCFK